jgi:hypothetical protein
VTGSDAKVIRPARFVMISDPCITVAVFQSVTALQLSVALDDTQLVVTRCHLFSAVVAQVARAARRVL